VTIDLQLNTLNVINPSASDASFIVGEFGGTPTFRLTNGTLRTQNSIIARAAHSMGSVILDNATWINQQDLYVGGDAVASGGAASLNISAGASLSVGGSTMLRGGGSIISAASAIDLGAIGMEGGRIALAPGGNKVIRGDALSMPANSGVIEMRDNGMILDYSAASPITTVRGRIRDAYAGGAWNGSSGITSADADAISFAIGFGEAGDIFASFPATFLGHAVDDDSTVLARLTRYGDANLDGNVNLADFNVLAINFGTSGAFWHEADFNYDEIVNLGDFNLLAANFGLTAGPDGPTPEDWSALASAVPEPSLGAAVMAIPLLLSWRRRRLRAKPARLSCPSHVARA
jgi:T5SS/PEP-CTERM-associated repeat protein